MLGTEKSLGFQKEDFFCWDIFYAVLLSCFLSALMLYLFCSEYSMQLNASRLKVLQAQDDLVSSMKEAAGEKLLNISDNPNSYKFLLKDLIVQVFYDIAQSISQMIFFYFSSLIVICK